MAKKVLGDDPFGKGDKAESKAAKPTKKIKRAPATSPKKTSAPKSTRAKSAPAAKAARAETVAAEVAKAATAVVEALVPTSKQASPDAAPGSWRWWRHRQLKLAQAEEQTWLMRADRAADRFGRDPQIAGRAEPIVDFLYRRWLRVAVRGLGHVPEAGRAILVVRRRTGGVSMMRSLAQAGLSRLGLGSFDSALDAALIRHAVLTEHVAHRDVRPLVHPARFYAPVVGSLLRKLGGVPSELHDFARLLDDDKVALATVGGDDRRGALDLPTIIAIALVTNAPIIPVRAVHFTTHGRGLFRSERTVSLEFGTPLFHGEEYGAEGAEDDALLAKLATEIETAL